MSALTDVLVATVKGCHRGRKTFNLTDDACIQKTKSGSLMVTFSRGCAFYRRLFQLDTSKENAFSCLVKAGFYIDVFSIQNFCEDMSKKPEDTRVCKQGTKDGWWMNTDFCIVVRPDKSVEFISRERALAQAVLALYK